MDTLLDRLLLCFMFQFRLWLPFQFSMLKALACFIMSFYNYKAFFIWYYYIYFNLTVHRQGKILHHFSVRFTSLFVVEHFHIIVYEHTQFTLELVYKALWYHVSFLRLYSILYKFINYYHPLLKVFRNLFFTLIVCSLRCSQVNRTCLFTHYFIVN